MDMPIVPGEVKRFLVFAFWMTALSVVLGIGIGVGRAQAHIAAQSEPTHCTYCGCCDEHCPMKDGRR